MPRCFMAEPRSFAMAAPRRGSPILRCAATTSSWYLSATLVARRPAALQSVLNCRDSSLDVAVAEAGVEFPLGQPREDRLPLACLERVSAARTTRDRVHRDRAGQVAFVDLLDVERHRDR